ncbi:MAG: type II secretion system major pseudopilin GspG [Methylacidiphilales bacterium]|nr:type II secretion system major pseudopilin GspG [Candidatus Methylacidiphilales bacterium]
MKFPSFSRPIYRALRRGFTLMEMLIVLTIIALLMGMVIYKIGDTSEFGKREKAQTDVLGFKQLLAAYQLETGSLPTTEQGLSVLWTKPSTEPVPNHYRALLEGEETKDPWGHLYQYTYPGKHNPDSYDVYSMGPDGIPDTADDIGNWPDSASTGN